MEERGAKEAIFVKLDHPWTHTHTHNHSSSSTVQVKILCMRLALTLSLTHCVCVCVCSFQWYNSNTWLGLLFHHVIKETVKFHKQHTHTHLKGSSYFLYISSCGMKTHWPCADNLLCLRGRSSVRLLTCHLEFVQLIVSCARTHTHTHTCLTAWSPHPDHITFMHKEDSLKIRAFRHLQTVLFFVLNCFSQIYKSFHEAATLR